MGEAQYRATVFVEVLVPRGASLATIDEAKAAVLATVARDGGSVPEVKWSADRDGNVILFAEHSESHGAHPPTVTWPRSSVTRGGLDPDDPLSIHNGITRRSAPPSTRGTVQGDYGQVEGP